MDTQAKLILDEVERMLAETCDANGMVHKNDINRYVVLDGLRNFINGLQDGCAEAKRTHTTEVDLCSALAGAKPETPLYSPMHGLLWLAEVDSANGIITCYKHPLDEGCTRAEIGQEETVSFFSDGTTGDGEGNVTKTRQLFFTGGAGDTARPLADITCNTEWTEDCCGKESLDFGIINAWTRYWPDHSSLCDIEFISNYNINHYSGEDSYFPKTVEPVILAQSGIMYADSEEGAKQAARRWYNENIAGALGMAAAIVKGEMPVIYYKENKE